MGLKWSLYLALVSGWLVVAADAEAQMFGSRTLGQTLARRARPGAAPTVEGTGTLSGGERFLRTNRRRTDFVGSDALEMGRFIGRVRGMTRGPVESSLTGFTVEQAPSANRPTAAAALRRPPVYPPRLELAEPVIGPVPQVVHRRLEALLQRCPGLGLYGPVEVSVEGGTAILRGVAASARDAEVAALVVAMEPGIAAVQNDLTIPAPTLPAAPAPQSPRPLPTR
jgi:hypothetical protein